MLTYLKTYFCSLSLVTNNYFYDFPYLFALFGFSLNDRACGPGLPSPLTKSSVT